MIIVPWIPKHHKIKPNNTMMNIPGIELTALNGADNTAMIAVGTVNAPPEIEAKITFKPWNKITFKANGMIAANELTSDGGHTSGRGIRKFLSAQNFSIRTTTNEITNPGNKPIAPRNVVVIAPLAIGPQHSKNTIAVSTATEIGDFIFKFFA